MPSEQRFISHDETPIFYRIWQPSEKSPSKASLIIVHGMGEHSGRYHRLATYAADLGITTYALDLRGYGRSGGKRYHLKRFEDYLGDLTALHAHVARTEAPRPVFILGHSLGGLISASYAANKRKEPVLAGLILSSPLFGVSVKIPLWKSLLASVAAVLAPTLVQKSGIQCAHLTHDSEILREYAQDKDIHQELSAGLFAQLEKYRKRYLSTAARIEIPVLVLQAGDDRIVSVKNTQSFYNNLSSANKSLTIYPDLYHEILNEKSRDQVFSAIGLWISQHC